jgi:hypothetical protein
MRRSKRKSLGEYNADDDGLGDELLEQVGAKDKEEATATQSPTEEEREQRARYSYV